MAKMPRSEEIQLSSTQIRERLYLLRPMVSESIQNEVEETNV